MRPSSLGAGIYALTVPVEAVRVEFLPAGSVAAVGGAVFLGMWILDLSRVQNSTVEVRTAAMVLSLMVWISLSYYWALDGDRALARIITYVQLGVISLVLLSVPDRVRALRSVCLAFFAANTVLATFALAEFSMNPGVERTTVLGADPNEMSINLVVSMALSIAVIPRVRPARAFGLAAWGIQISALLVSGSRTGLVAAATVMALLAILTANTPKRKAVVATVSIPIPFLLLLVIEKLPAHLVARFGSIGEQLASGDVGNRGAIWRHGLELVWDRPIQGWGAGNFAEALRRSWGYEMASHNSVLNVAAELGAVGALLTGIIFLSAVRAVTPPRCAHQRALSAALLALVMASSTLTLDYRKVTWLILSLCLMQGYLSRSGNESCEASRS